MRIQAKIGDIIEIDNYPRKILISLDQCGPRITIDGYEDCCSLTDVARIDMYGVDGWQMGLADKQDEKHVASNADPRVLVYADADDGDPTHTVSLKGRRSPGRCSR